MSNGYVVHLDNLPAWYPTHRQNSLFWESLGRTVATFGFLEEVLGKAIFAFTATRRYPDAEIEAAYEKWLLTLERALSDALGGLIQSYGNAVRAQSAACNDDFEKLLGDLHEAKKIRDVLCHGSWRAPDANGRSFLFFVNKKKMIFDTPIDVAYLNQTQRAVAELACAVVTTVTRRGWQFPGSSGPGQPL